MKTLTFNEFVNMIAYTIEKKLYKHGDDQFFPCCGYEGRGKSTFSIALQCAVYKKLGKKPNKHHIFFSWQEYLAANIQIMRSMVKQEKQNKDIIDELLTYYEIDLDDPMISKVFETDYHVNPGSILVYDEAGTQAHSRESLKQDTVDMSKLLILNRFLKSVHIINCPKPQSLEKYAREQRPRGMIWCVASYTKDLEERLHGAFFYTQESYNEIFCQRRWWQLFSNDFKLVDKVQPDFQIKLDQDIRKHIPSSITKHYESKKLVFGIKQTLDMWRGHQERRTDKKVNENLIVKDGESQRDWVMRTKQHPSAYFNYRLKEGGGG